MAKTFDNISEASATNYLFLFAQRTLALQNEPPTPPPLNVVGLPCEATCLLWAWVKKQKQKHQGTATADKVRLSTLTGSESSDEATQGETAPAVVVGVGGDGGDGGGRDGGGGDEGGVSGGDGGGGDGGGGDGGGGDAGGGVGGGVEGAVAAEEEEEEDAGPAGEIEAATEKNISNSELSAEKIATLAKKITEYILDHQDDVAQEDRWRTTMKRDMVKDFRVQHEEVQKVKEEVKAEVRKVKEEIKAEVQKVIKEEVQAMQLEMHSKMDDMLERVKSQCLTVNACKRGFQESYDSLLSISRREQTESR